MAVHGGKLAARALKEAGVECIFTLSGGHVMAIYDGCLDEGIKVVDVRHEQAAVHAADAWSRLNPGKIGCAVLTAGPGVTDGVTGVANAWRANSPILVIGGQGPFNNLRRLPRNTKVGPWETHVADTEVHCTKSSKALERSNGTPCRACTVEVEGAHRRLTSPVSAML